MQTFAASICQANPTTEILHPLNDSFSSQLRVSCPPCCCRSSRKQPPDLGSEPKLHGPALTYLREQDRFAPVVGSVEYLPKKKSDRPQTRSQRLSLVRAS